MLDSTIGDEDWVVADSENEDDNILSQAGKGRQQGVDDTVSTIQTATFTADVRPQATANTTVMSSFSVNEPADTSMISLFTPEKNIPPHSRPRPRPLKKLILDDIVAATPGGDNRSIESIRTGFLTNGRDDDELLHLDIASRAKMRSRTSTKSTSSATPSSSTSVKKSARKVSGKVIPEETIEISDEDDELRLVDEPLQAKSRKSELAAEHTNTALPLSSPLFPSDPPDIPPSAPPSEPTPPDQLPSIAVLEQDRSPTSSPVLEARRRNTLQMRGRGSPTPHDPGMDLDTQMMPPPPPPRAAQPPPTFFAPSSSSSSADVSIVEIPALPTPAPKKGSKKKNESAGTKAVPKLRPKPKKNTGAHVEVVIPKATKSKGKGKAQETVTFTSAEFINDEDEDDLFGDSTVTTPPTPPPQPVTPVAPPVEQESELSSVPESEEETARRTASSTKGKAKKRPAKEQIEPRSTKRKKCQEKIPQKSSAKRRKSKVVESDGEENEDAALPVSSGGVSDKEKKRAKAPAPEDDEHGDDAVRGDDTATAKVVKENVSPNTKVDTNMSTSAPKPLSTPTPSTKTSNRSYSISAKLTKSTPMSELIRRVNSLPSSPFAGVRGTSYSPYTKSSRSALMRIAPLHPNRRTPPPPLPRAPPPKKTKKQLQLEEKWEEELADSIEGWACLPDEERAALRRAKREREMGGWED